MEYNLTDTHSHLYDEAFDADRAGVVARARDVGVGAIVLPAIDSGTHERLLAMCGEYPDLCYPSMGLHPTSVNGNPLWRDELRIVGDYLRQSADGKQTRFYAVGEVGLDLYWSRDYLREQVEAFRRQIELSLEYSLPLIVHTREAWEEMRSLLASYKGGGIRGIMHSFSGSVDDYEFIVGCGDFLFGVGGPVTYKNSSMADVVSRMDIGNIVLETDSPYLPPVPFRGKRNESSYIVIVCEEVARIKGMTPAEVARITTDNAAGMFGIEISPDCGERTARK